MKTKILMAMMVVCALSVSALGAVVLEDDFEGASLDLSKWEVVVGTVTQSGGVVNIGAATGRDYMVSVGSWSPDDGVLTVSGTISSMSDFEIWTRAANVRDLGFAGGTLDSGIRIGGWANATDILEKASGSAWVAVDGSPGTAPFQGAPVDFLITDDGTNLSIVYTLVSDPLQTITVPVTTTLPSQTANHIGFGGTGTIELDNLVVTQVQETAVLIAPMGNSVDPTTALEWSAPETYVPEGYDLVFRANDANFIDTANNIIEITDATATSPQAVTLDYSTTYYWQVTAYEPNTVGTSPVDIPHVGPVWTFTTIPPEPVITAQPASETGASVDLFVAASSAEVYEWYLLGDPNVLVQTTGTLGTSGDPDNTYTTSVEGYYYCVVSNTNGSATSQTVRVMTPRLVGHWALDGNMTDSSVEGIWDGDYIDPNALATQPVAGDVVYVDGADGTAGNAVEFDSNLVITIPGSNEFFRFQPQGVTLSAWINVSTDPNGFGWYKRMVGLSDAYAISHAESSKGIGTIITGSGWGQTVIPDAAEVGQWRLVAVTYDPTTGQQITYGVYGDAGAVEILNTLVLDRSVPGTPSTVDFRMGGIAEYNFIGAIDDVRVYNYALTADDIQGLYSEMTSQALCMNIDDPILEYDFNLDCQVTLEDFASFAAAWLNSQLQGP